MDGFFSPQQKRALLYRGMGFFFPFLTLPLFVRQISAADYGSLGVALTTCGVIQAICEGGANVGGAKRLALATSDVERGQIIAGIYRYKWMLLLLSLIGGMAYSLALRPTWQDASLFLACFIFVVIPDALTPSWSYYSAGAVDELTAKLFFSKVYSLVPIILLIWLVPNPYVAAFACGLPFQLLAFMARTRASELQPYVRTEAKGVMSAGHTEGQRLVHLGSLAALTFPAVVMQSLAWSRSDNLGAAYLAITLWIALRQLCMIPNQSVFHIAVKGDLPPEQQWHRLRRAVIIGGTLALVAAAGVHIVGGPLLAFAFGEQYSSLSGTLVVIFASVAIYAVAHGLVLNRLAAKGRNAEFSGSYFLALSGFFIVFWASGLQGEQRLQISIVAADLSLLLGAIVFELHSQLKRTA
jgi:O-antigen/teichoic acid export membrane protein